MLRGKAVNLQNNKSSRMTQRRGNHTVLSQPGRGRGKGKNKIERTYMKENFSSGKKRGEFEKNQLFWTLRERLPMILSEDTRSDVTIDFPERPS